MLLKALVLVLNTANKALWKRQTLGVETPQIVNGVLAINGETA